MSAKQDFQLKKWQYLLKDYRESGKKLITWCSDNNVTKDQYYYWLRRLQSKYYDSAVKQLQSSKASENTALVAQTGSFVEISPEIVSEAFKEARLPAAVVQKDNIRIEIMSNATASFIKQLLTAVHYA